MTAPSAPRSPARRLFLRAGLFVGGAVALFGSTVFLRRGIADQNLTPAGKEVIRAVGLAVFNDVLPQDPVQRSDALDRHVANMDAMLGNLPPALRFEISTLIGALANMAGRMAMTGMVTSWSDASAQQVQAALEKLRLSPLAATQSIYHGLRDLSCVSFFADPQNWKLAGYNGQLDV